MQRLLHRYALPPSPSPSYNTHLHLVTNFIPAELTLDRIVASAGINNTVYASLDHNFTQPLVIPFFGYENTGVIQNVLLTQGALASLEIVPLKYLDVFNTTMYLRRVGCLTLFGSSFKF
ncbi:hypothetical protein IW261DRAFT_1399331 [Armillaria novae-zelandiae]|uniref:Uncharacterized protein n=1 Tax=Armillaria novae-zelandiae TaxID=153914 RepID=A0AA39P998_9AGAR|nr:hypothetical protein IW261DRAFT_1399331 [Armillaria novae-zelandiae]